jgi:hypothetical protein
MPTSYWSEEVRHPVVAELLAEHGAGRGGSAVERVGPMLDTDPRLIQRGDRVGDVACSEDIGGVGTQRGIDEDAVVNRKSGCSASSVLSWTPTLTMTTSAGIW